MTIERIAGLSTERVPFPEDPREVIIGGNKVLEYLSPREVEKHIGRLAEAINFGDYEAAVVNMKGGDFLFKRLIALSGSKIPRVDVEFHRPVGGFGVRIVVPVPEYLRGRKVLAVDDIIDSGGTADGLMKYFSPDSSIAALLTKCGIQDRMSIPNALIAAEIDNRWVGGCGMDIGFDGEEDLFRNHPGLVVNPNVGFSL